MTSFRQPRGGITKADADAAYQQVWKASTAYAQGAIVVSPAGQLVRRKSAGTSGATYDPSAWDVITDTRLVVTTSSLGRPESGTYSNVECTFRVADMLPYAPTAWRLRIRNRFPRSGSAVSSGATFLPVYVGQQALNADGSGQGAFTAAPTQALPGFTLPADGSEYVSPWVTDAALQPPANTAWLYSLAFTGGTTQANGHGQIWFSGGTGTSAAVSAQASPGSEIAMSMFDLRIEYQVLIPRQISTGLVVGDSLSGGGGAVGAMPAYKAWPGAYARRTRSLVTNGGIGGARLSEWASPTSLLWDRVAGATPDYAIVFLGANDLTANATYSQMQGWFASVVTNLRALGIQRILAMTVTPRAYPHARLDARAASGSTSLVVMDSIATGSYQLGEGVAAETVTVSAVSGSGPYTLTLSAATTKNHNAEETMFSGQEIVRLQFNAWLRTLPGVAAALPADRVMASAVNKHVLAPDFAAVDGLHFNLAGYTTVADAINIG